MHGSLADIIDSCLNERMELPVAQQKAVVLGNTPEKIISTLQEIAKKVDQLRGAQPDYEFVASFVCWEAAHRIQDDELTAQLAFNLGRSFLIREDFDQAQLYLDKAEQYVRQTNKRFELAAILGSRAGIFLMQGRLDEALALYRESYALAREAGYSSDEAASALGIGQVMSQKGDTSEGHRWLEKALELYRSLGRPLDEFKTLVSLSRITREQPDTQQRVDYLSQAVALARQVTVEPRELLQLLGELATLQIKQGLWTEAEKNLQQALWLARDSSDRFMEGYFAGNLGSLYGRTGRRKESRELQELALRIAQECNDSQGAAIARQNLELLDKSERIARDLSDG